MIHFILHWGIIQLVIGFIAGLLVGRKNPSVAEAVAVKVETAKSKIEEAVK